MDQEDLLRASMVMSDGVRELLTLAISWDGIQTTDLALNMRRTGMLAYSTAHLSDDDEAKVCSYFCYAHRGILRQPRQCEKEVFGMNTFSFCGQR